MSSPLIPNLRVTGSNPVGVTNKFRGLAFGFVGLKWRQIIGVTPGVTVFVSLLHREFRR
jgi:hypothetical protein